MAIPGKGKPKVPKADLKARVGKTQAPAKGNKEAGSGDLAAEVNRLAREMDAIKEMLSKRLAAGGDGGASRRDQDKILADRLVRLDERVDSLWARVSDLEEALEGEGGRASRDTDFDETPDREFYER